MAEVSRESEYHLTGSLLSALVQRGYGISIRRLYSQPCLTAFATDDLGAVKYYSTGHSVSQAISNLYELIEKEREDNECPF